ncbi:pentapeptide repeat-containing protein [Aeromicrobium sp. CnD17-E]|uniref:pentapeptide repeat-containing protein n=1 Tax=Aeromicrobium sp. CnD17-E TaxID=2954487 RepID=UPI0020975D5D|nr:pentapeptide repeat-containing protein [Aeromicrobium sp. CnD17-E]MCO7238793.1 pentapeptide repeat-containing protein [Aeromicrobium sp. CnD17-E]
MWEIVDFTTGVARELGLPVLVLAIAMLLTFILGEPLKDRLSEGVLFGSRAALTVGVFVLMYIAWTAWRSSPVDSDRSYQAIETGQLQFKGKTIAGASFVGRELIDADFQLAQLRDVDFRDANLSEADFRGANLRNVNFESVNLCGADFRGADLRGVKNFSGIANMSFLIYDDSTKYPDGVDPGGLIGPVNSPRPAVLFSCRAGKTRLYPLDAGRMKR